MLDSMYASRRKEMKEKGIGGLSRLLKRVATAELIKKKRPRDSLNPLPRRSSIYKCFLSLLVSRLEKQPSPWLNGDGAVIDISHRIIAKFSKAHSLAGLNRCEQLFDNDPDAACCICRFQLVFPRCFQSHDALNPCGKGTVPRPALQPTRPTPLQSNASDEKTCVFCFHRVLVAVQYARPRHSNVHHRMFAAWLTFVCLGTLIGCGDTTVLYLSPSGSC